MEQYCQVEATVRKMAIRTTIRLTPRSNPKHLRRSLHFYEINSPNCNRNGNRYKKNSNFGSVRTLSPPSPGSRTSLPVLSSPPTCNLVPEG
mmetsp:Transcript_18154/g.41340  ORF Transcript_18154/g.41340 Transcript_18154/m.41340 type:complete len:91 (+) Transcript_18154:2334-2606(+)